MISRNVGLSKRVSPLVSIVIPTYDSSFFIEQCLNSVFNTRYPKYEVIVVDDCSSDNTLEIIRRKYRNKSNLKILQNDRRRLAAYSRNVGFTNSEGEYIALLDHDVIVDPRWIRELIRAIRNNPDIGIVQSKVFDINKRSVLQCVGVKIFPQVGWVHSVGFGQEDDGSYDNLSDLVGGATGILYRKRAFEKIGGFDEKLGINVDDLDLNWRMWIAGYKTVVAPKALIYHWSKKQMTRDRWLGRINWEFHYAKMIRVFVKNYSTKNLIKNLPILFIVYFLRGVFNLTFRLNFAPLFGFIAALLWNVYFIPDTLKQRDFIQRRLRGINDSVLLDTIFINKSLFKIFLEIWLPYIRSGFMMASEKID